MTDLLSLIWLVGGAIVVVAFGWIIITALFYRKVSPNQVLIVSGWRGESITDARTGEKRKLGFRIVQGGGTRVLPILERTDILSLEVMTLDIAPPESYTKLGVPIKVDGVAQVKVKGDDVSIRTAAEQFLSKSIDQIKQIAYQTVSGHLRAILGTLTVEEIYSGHEVFAQRVAEVASADLANMGLTVVSFTIREISDSMGYLEAVGKPQIARIKRDAAIAEADADRDSTIRRAQADQEAQTQRFLADIAIAQSQRDFNLKQQEYAANINQARAQTDLAYDLQKYKQAQAVKAEEIQVGIIEKQKQIEMETSEIKRRELELQATVQKPAEAERLRIEALANAEQYRLKTTAQGQAEAVKSEGFAKADIVKAQGNSEADVVRAKGLAEADAIKAKGLAEAEAMAKRADAYRSYNEAAVAQMYIEKLPEIAAAIASPLAKVDRIVLVNTNGGDGIGASKITGEITNIMTQVPPVLEAMTGVDLGDLIKRIPGLGDALASKATSTAAEGTPTAAVPPKPQVKPKQATE